MLEFQCRILQTLSELLSVTVFFSYSANGSFHEEVLYVWSELVNPEGGYDFAMARLS
jgi:hypothetical protein